MRKRMRVSAKGIAELAEHEGIVPGPYLDSVGVWTFGVGHTAEAGRPDPEYMDKGMPRDVDAALRLAFQVFATDLRKFENRVNEAIEVPLEQHEFDALVSFDFNTGGIYRAKLTAAINAGDPDASEHFYGWMRPPEIRTRRKAEKRLFDTGNYDANGDQIAVWGVDDLGNLTAPIMQMDGFKAVKLIQEAQA
ncbi:MAG: lysozyme [Pseudomonadota bacterium]